MYIINRRAQDNPKAPPTKDSRAVGQRETLLYIRLNTFVVHFLRAPC